MGLDQGQASQCHPVKIDLARILQQLLVLNDQRWVPLIVDPLCGSSIQHCSAKLIEGGAHVPRIFVADDSLHSLTEEPFLFAWWSHLERIRQIKTREFGVRHNDFSEAE